MVGVLLADAVREVFSVVEELSVVVEEAVCSPSVVVVLAAVSSVGDV